MEEINLKELFKLFYKKIGLVILIILFVVLFGAIYSLVVDKPRYEAKTSLVLTGTTDEITATDLTLNSKLVSTYREIIKSKTALKEVIETLALDYTIDEIMGMVRVTSVQDTEMISIAVQSENARETAEIANELARVFSEQIVDIFKIENISIIDRAEVPTTTINNSIVKLLVIYFAIGFILACAVIFAIYYFDTTLKDASQLENMGLVVLANVPKIMDEKGRKK